MGAFLAGGVLARRTGVSPLEQRSFRLINDLPAAMHPPAWVVMQGGSLGGALGLAAAVGTKRPALALRMAIAGTTAWAVAKVVKRSFGRARPAVALDAARVLGQPAGGLGYPSGHAAVAAARAAVATAELARPWRGAVWVVALLVGPTRLYVGAHLPLDVAGGVGLGVAIGAATRA